MADESGAGAPVPGPVPVEGGAEIDEDEVLGVFDADDIEGVQEAMDAIIAQHEAQMAAASGNTADEVEDGSRVTMLEHDDSVYAVDVSPKAPLAVSGDGADSWILWDLRDGSVVAKTKAHADSIVDVAFSADGSMFASASMDNTVKTWSATDGSAISTLEGPSDEVHWISWHPKGNALAAGSADGTVWMWDATDGSVMKLFTGHSAPVTCGSWTPSGKYLVSGDAAGVAIVWSGKSGDAVGTFSGHGWLEGGVVAITVHPTQPLILVGGEDGTARLASLATFKPLAIYPHLKPGSATTSATAAVATLAADAAADAAGESAPPTATAAGGEAGGDPDVEVLQSCSVEGVSFFTGKGSDEGARWAATGATDGTLRVWDLSARDTRQALRHSILHPDAIIAVRWHPVHPVLFSACADGVVRLYDARTGANVKEYSGSVSMVLGLRLYHPASVAAAAVEGAAAGGEGAEGKAELTRLQIVTAGDDQVCRVFDV